MFSILFLISNCNYFRADGTSHCPSALSYSDSSGEGHYFSKITQGRVRSHITDWFRFVFHFFLLGALSFVRGCLSTCLSCLSVCSLAPLERSIRHKRRKIIRGTGSQAAARRGALSRQIALSVLVRGGTRPCGQIVSLAFPECAFPSSSGCCLLPCPALCLVATVSALGLEVTCGLIWPLLHPVSAIFHATQASLVSLTCPVVSFSCAASLWFLDLRPCGLHMMSSSCCSRLFYALPSTRMAHP